ncbi:MAG TPA: hypothetical protein VFA34_05635 [Actinomycetota bacterium]|nr:hypothetical protein [Actinomycetota bacterium]
MTGIEGEPVPPSFWRAVRVTFDGVIRHWRTCLALVSVYAILNGVSNAIGRADPLDFDPSAASPSELVVISAAALAGIGTLALIWIFVHPPTLGALSLVGSAVVAGDELETHGIVRRVLDRALEVIGAFVLTLLILLVAPIAIGLFGLVANLVTNAETTIAAMFALAFVLAVPVVYMFVRLSLAIPVVLREGLGPVAALRRSWDLVGGVWWWVFGVFVVVGIAGGIGGGILAAILSLGNAGISGSGDSNFVLAALGSAVSSAVSGSLLGVVTGVVYEARAEVLSPSELPLPDVPGE